MQRTQEKGATVTEVIAGLKEWEQQHGPFDRATRLPLFQYVVQEGTGGALVPLSSGVTNLPPMKLAPHAHGQFLSRLSYPDQLYKRLPPKLNLLNVNWLIQNGAYEKGTLFRVIDGDTVRAIMSEQFAAFDHLELLTLVEPYLADGIVRWSYNDDLTLHLSVSFPSTATEIKVGEVVEQGIHVSNSEVGVRSVTIAGYVYVLRCSNGNVGGGGGDSFRFRHTGSSDRLRQMVEGAIQSTKLEAERIVQQFKAAVQVKIDEPFQVIENLAKDGNLSQEKFKECLNALMEAPEISGTLYGVSQAFSRAAQKYHGEESYELQRLAVAATSKVGS